MTSNVFLALDLKQFLFPDKSELKISVVFQTIVVETLQQMLALSPLPATRQTTRTTKNVLLLSQSTPARSSSLTFTGITGFNH